jgi:hypothetical protein
MVRTFMAAILGSNEVHRKELRKGIQTLTSNPTVSMMTHLCVMVLEALVQEYGVKLSSRTHPRKKDMIEALLVS